MKAAQLLVSLLALILLSTIAAAYDTTLATQQVGWGFGDAAEAFTPHYYYAWNGNSIYFQLEKAGVIDIELAACRSGGTDTIKCEYANQSGTTLTWIQFIPATTLNCTNPDYNWTSVKGTANTNTGLIACSRIGVGNGFFISPDNSNITFTTPDYSLRSYVAGSSYPTYLLTGYYPGSTYIIKDGIPAADFEFPIAYTSYLNLTTFTPSCSEATGIYSYVLLNQNDSDSTQSQVTAWYANITGITPLNFTLTNPGTTHVIPVGGVANFSVVASNPAAVDYVTWYINGSLIQVSATNYSFSYQFTAPGTYLVEAQLEDNTCGRYPTANFTVEVGKTITITGQVKSSTFQSITGAKLLIINKLGTYSDDTTSDSLGAYTFTLLPADNYTVYATAAGYESNWSNKVYNYSSFSVTTYTTDIILATTSKIGSAQILALDVDSGNILTDYTLTFYSGAIETGMIPLVVITNGTVTYNVSPINYLVTNAGNPSTITNITIESSYSAEITKLNYIPAGSYADWVQSEQTEDIILYLRQIPNYTEDNSTFYVNFTDIRPLDGATINASNTPSIDVNATITTSIDDYFTICFSYQRSGYPQIDDCYPWAVTGVIDYGHTIPNLVPGTTYSFLITANQSSTNSYFSSGLYEFTTTGTINQTSTTIHITTTTTLIPATTSTTVTTLPVTTTTLVIPTNATATNISFNCTNLTGKLKSGDVFHCAVCPFIMILGVSWFYGLSLLFILATTYHLTKTWAVPGILALLYTSAFIVLLPQPTISYLSIGVGLGVGMTLYGLFRK